MARTADCAAAATIARRPRIASRAVEFEFLTRESRWIAIPSDRITFLPIPGDPPSDDLHRAHLCYRHATDEDRKAATRSNVFEDIYLYCAFIPPGST